MDDADNERVGLQPGSDRKVRERKLVEQKCRIQHLGRRYCEILWLIQSPIEYS
jgi:hypothetical protein